MPLTNSEFSDVLISSTQSTLEIILNRPDKLNSLNTDMVIKIRDVLLEASNSDEINCIIIRGSGTRAFCAGGDVRELYGHVQKKHFMEGENFFASEYEMDLLVHRHPKLLIVIADGITMGGGLGIAAGADFIIATERTQMAMPETRIGFFPDVGATGWLHSRCGPGYPEFLSLTGFRADGLETVRIGLATDFIKSEMINDVIIKLKELSPRLSKNRLESAAEVELLLSEYKENDIPPANACDKMIKAIFHKKNTVEEIMKTALDKKLPLPGGNHFDIYSAMKEMSPTAQALTFKMLNINRERALENVFQSELAASSFMIRHHDYQEGIRARLIDRDNTPQWKPSLYEDIELPDYF